MIMTMGSIGTYTINILKANNTTIIEKHWGMICIATSFKTVQFSILC